MSAPLTSAGAMQQIPTTQTLQPTSMDQTRNVERKEPSPQSYQIQALQAPSAQTQTTNKSSDGQTSLDNKDILESIMAIKEMQETGELPDKGAVLDISA
jgi:hypothetical protein